MRSNLGTLALALEAEVDAHSIWRLRGLLQDCDAVQQRLAELDERVEDAFREHRRQLNMLEAIPGIRRASAHAILAEIGPDPAGTFPKAADLAAWAGVCPDNNERAGKRRSGRTRRGNAALRHTLTECAHAAAPTRGSQFHGYHQALTARIGFKKAIVATAHKMLRMLKKHGLVRELQANSSSPDQ